METISKSESQTQKIAQSLAKNLKGGDFIALYGDLGAGKTVFTQGVAQALGIKKRVLSPTFVFIRSYPLTINHKPLTFYHVDLYRGQTPQDFQSLGLEDVFADDSIVVIEWAEKIAEILPKKRIDVTITTVNEKTRRIEIIPPPVILSRQLAEKDLKKRFFIPFRMTMVNSNINKAVSILKSGGVVIFPTDTVYGIGCRFDDKKAVDRIYQIKGTSQNQPFPILVSDIKQVAKLAKISKVAKSLMDKHWPGALTIILPIKPDLSTYHKPGLKQLHKPGLNQYKIGFRMPNSALVRLIIDKVGKPIIGTSANFHGHPTPKSYEELDPDFIKLVDYVIKGKCKGGVESTVADATVNPPKILRLGAVRI